MRVLKPGRKQQGWAQEYDCTGNGNGGGGCGARLLVEEGDLYLTTTSSMGEVEACCTFACAECGHETDVPPPPIKSNWRNRNGP